MRKQWEYEYADKPRLDEYNSQRDAEDILNNLGAEGWELCGEHHGFFVFKRGLEE
jgi:hypothetical protein